LASFGLARVKVHRRLRVAVLSSGDELREPGETLLPGQLYNANRYSLLGVLRGLGCEVNDLPVMPDDLARTRDTLARAAAEHDVLVSSGGVSVGEEDPLRLAVSQLGELHLWRLAIQPGKPLAFGDVKGVPWIGLPGNPAAALITALGVGRRFLLPAQACDAGLPRPLGLPSGLARPKANGRATYLRARL